MSLARTLARNVAFSWSGFLVQIGVTFLLTPYVLKHLGELRYGIWSIVVSVTGYYGLIDVGFRPSLTQNLTRHLANKDYGELNRSASAGFVCCSVVGILGVVASVVGAIVLPWIFTIPDEINAEFRWSFAILGLGTALQFPFFVYTAVFSATQRFDAENVITVVTRLAYGGGIAWAVARYENLIGISVAIVASNLLDYLLRWRTAIRILPQLNIGVTSVDRAGFLNFIRFGVWHALTTACQRILTYTDTIVIALCLSVTFVTPYAVAAGIVTYIDALITRIGWVVFPSAARLFIRAEIATLRSLYLHGCRLSYSFTAVVSVVGVVWAQDFFTLWLSKGLDASGVRTASLVFLILAAGATLSAGQKIGGQILLGSQNFRQVAILSLGETLLNLVVSVILARTIGLLGVAIGTFLAAVVFQGLAYPHTVCRALGIPRSKYVADVLGRPALVTGVAIAACWGLKQCLPSANTWFMLITHGIAAGISGVGILFVVALTKTERRSFRQFLSAPIFAKATPDDLEATTDSKARDCGTALRGPATPTVVFVSNFFPPDAAIGALRVGKLATGLAKAFGYRIVVIRNSRPPVADTDRSSNDLPTELRVVEAKDWNVVRLVSAIKRLRFWSRPESSQPRENQNVVRREDSIDLPQRSSRRGILASLSDLLAVPDISCGWIWPARQAAIHAVRQASGSAILFSSGPPHSAHVAAASVKQRTGTRWIADLRDPWGANPYAAELSSLATRWNLLLERRTLSQADAILCNTEAARDLLLRRLPKLRPERVFTVPNGYDEEDFQELVPQPLWPECDRPVLMHAGSLYGKRNPFGLLTALGHIFQSAPERCPKLVLLGSWEPQTRRKAEAIIGELQLAAVVVLLPSAQRAAALAALAAADALVLLGDAEPSQVQIPAKLFEYLRLGKPILSLVGQDSPAVDFLNRYGVACQYARPDDAEGVEAAIRRLATDLQSPRTGPSGDIRELSRENHIRRVHEIIESLLRTESTETAPDRVSASTAAGQDS